MAINLSDFFFLIIRYNKNVHKMQCGTARTVTFSFTPKSCRSLAICNSRMLHMGWQRGKKPMSGSEAKIVKAFGKLLTERPYNKITVKSIVETAHLHRNTFYYHFSDIPALLDYMGERWIDMVLAKIDPQDGHFSLEHAFIGFAEDHRVQILNLYNSDAREKLEGIIRSMSRQLARTYLNSFSDRLQFSARESAALNRFISSSICGIITCWIADGMAWDPGYDFKCYKHFAESVHSLPDGRNPVDTSLLQENT